MVVRAKAFPVGGAARVGAPERWRGAWRVAAYAGGSGA
jgi:hypothetical protein